MKITYKKVLLIDIVKRVVENHTALLMRVDPDFIKVEGEDYQYNCDNWRDGDFQTEDDELTDSPPRNASRRKGWTLLDAFTASGLLTVYNAMNEDNKKKFNRIHFLKMIDIMWTLIK